MKSKEPQIKVISEFPFEDDEMGLRANGHILLEITSRDKSYIRYTLDNSFPTPHIGNMVFNVFLIKHYSNYSLYISIYI